MPRPSEVTIVEYQESDTGFEMWVDVAGTVVQIGGPLQAIDSRKVAFGYADLYEVVNVREENGREVVSRTGQYEVEDRVPDADVKALQHIIEERLDAWDGIGHGDGPMNIHEKEWMRPEQVVRGRPQFRRVGRHENRRVQVNGRAPEPPAELPVKVRKREVT